MAGVLFALIPFIAGLFGVLGYWSSKVAQSTAHLDGKTASFIEQIISSIRIVHSFDMGQRLLVKLDDGMLRPLISISKRKAASNSLEQSVAFGATFIVYSFSYWYGGVAVSDGVSVGHVLTVRRF